MNLLNVTKFQWSLVFWGQEPLQASHPLFLGMGGMHGSFAANIAMTRADFMISIGCRFDDRLTGNPQDLC